MLNVKESQPREIVYVVNISDLIMGEVQLDQFMTAFEGFNRRN